jgi:hypothetical protein
MRLDHVSYVTSHDQISDVVNRIGSQIGTAFVDGGIHPKFGTRNFTAPLLNGQYIEVVCPMDHPATETTPFGKAVKKKASEGSGWLAWVVETQVMEEIEDFLNREAFISSRIKPDGTKLEWQQIGVDDLLNDSATYFFIKWISTNHPSSDGTAKAALKKIELNSVAKNNKIIQKYWKNLEPYFTYASENLSPGGDINDIEFVVFEIDNKLIKIY